jgi:hypothetical protein
MRLILAVAAVLVLASLGWLVPLARDSHAAPAPSTDAAFKGKVLLVNLSNTMPSTFLLEKAQAQKIGDHSFLVGKGTADGRIGGWYKGRTVRLQMEHIVSITEFDDLKDAKKALESGGVTVIGGTYVVPGGSAPAVAPVDVAVPAAPPAPAPAVPPPPAAAPPGKQ